MSSEELRILSMKGMDIQSHCKTHRYLNEMEVGEIQKEFISSRERLSQIIKKPIDFISFPGGRYNQTVLMCADNLGFRAVFSSRPYFKKQVSERTYLLGRYGIKSSTGGSLDKFERLINLSSLDQAKTIYSYYGKNLLKKVLGRKLYYFLWKKYTGKG